MKLFLLSILLIPMVLTACSEAEMEAILNPTPSPTRIAAPPQQQPGVPPPLPSPPASPSLDMTPVFWAMIPVVVFIAAAVIVIQARRNRRRHRHR